MKHKFKNALAVAMLFLLAASGGIATARFSGTTRMISNSFSVLNGQKKQQDAGILKEPDWDNGGKDLAAKGMKSGEAVPKNPYIVSNADWTSWAFMKVDIPLFSDGTDSVSLLNLSDNWKLLKDEVNGSVHTKIYGYKTRLAGGNSKKSESDRAKTDSLFDSFKACNTSEDKPFVGSLNVCGTLVQSDDTDDLSKIVERAEFDDSAASEAIFRISYDLDDGTLTGQKYLYTKDDYGYVPPTPVKDGFVFTGWSPASIPDGSTGDITFISGWTPNILTINYHSSGASNWEDPNGSATNLDTSKDVIVHTDKIAYDGDYSSDSTHPANAGLLDTNRLKKTGYHTGNLWKTDAGKEVSDQTDMIGYKGSNTADYLGVLPEFKKKSTTVDIHTEWTANTYTIEYDVNAPSGTTPLGSMADMGCTYDESKALSANAYSINNYSFLSWNTNADGSGTSFADGATVKNLTTANNGTVTLYAQWKQDIFGNIKFDLNGGTGDVSNERTSYTAENYGYKPSVIPVRKGYTFTGWSPTSIANGTNGDITFTAIWKANTYTIKYNANAPTGATSNGSMADTGCTYDTNKTLSSNAYSINSYYSFLSWNTKANGSGTSYANGATVKNLTSENNGVVTLYAQWKLAAKSWDFNYTGGVQSWTCPATGTYKLETWGAQAGYDKFDWASRKTEGAQGGYVAGQMTITKGTTLYICVGGRGGRNHDGSDDEGFGGNGGYNGGGRGGDGYRSGRQGSGGSGGGGATHIAKTNRGILSNYASNQNEVLIVAAGGGGSCYGINGTSGGSANKLYKFGQGQDGLVGLSDAHEGGGGGGGGWYGGTYGDNGARPYGNGRAPSYGGSHYTSSQLSNVTKQNGGRNGNGFARITAVR